MALPESAADPASKPSTRPYVQPPAGISGVAPGEIALTDSTTMGLGLAYHGMALQPGDHILTRTHDFYSTHEALRLAAARTGAEVERIALYDDPAAASADVMVDRLAAAVRPATRIVALTWVHSSTGVKIPVRQIAMYSLRSTATATPGSRPGCTSTPSTAWALMRTGRRSSAAMSSSRAPC